MGFSAWIENRSRRINSRVVLALDLDMKSASVLLRQSLEMLESTSEHICAVKINRQLAIPIGLYGGVEKVVSLAHRLDMPAIMDAKINDVGHTNRAIAEHCFNVGFDAVTASPFIGWTDGLEPVFQLARENEKGVLLLVYMSHRGSEEGYGQMVIDRGTGGHRLQFEVFAEKAVEWDADGAIVGATFPENISLAHKILGKKVPIYSPGVGAQGGEIETAIKSGTRYLIVGRTIYEADSPAEAAARLKNAARRAEEH